MTSLVAIRCSDGVVIGSDSAVTFGKVGIVSTIEQKTAQKLRIIDSRLVVGGTGQLGLLQRFHACLEKAHKNQKFLKCASAIDVAKLMSSLGIQDFNDTHLEKFDFSAFVAFEHNGKPFLCELDGGTGFQPELKELDDLWYASAGIGQIITDPFLALLREAFWSENPPNLRGGIFTALWALRHVCKLNSGGIGDPIRIAVLEPGAQDRARFLRDDELAEHENMVDAAMNHLGGFRNILAGNSQPHPTPIIPKIEIGLSANDTP